MFAAFHNQSPLITMTWVASSLANIMKKMLFTTGLPVHCFSSVSDWAIDESWRKGKKSGGRERERRFCFFPVLSLLLQPIFALFRTHNKQTRERLLRRILLHQHGRLFIVLEDLQYSPSDSHGNAYWRVLFKLSFAACSLFSFALNHRWTINFASWQKL